MCRADVQPQARGLLASVLSEIRDELCRREGADPATVTCGPVDFGQPQHNKETATMGDERALIDLRDRLIEAEAGLLKLRNDRDDLGERARLAAKAEGVGLARSYVDEYIRSAVSW